MPPSTTPRSRAILQRTCCCFTCGAQSIEAKSIVLKCPEVSKRIVDVPSHFARSLCVCVRPTAGPRCTAFEASLLQCFPPLRCIRQWCVCHRRFGFEVLDCIFDSGLRDTELHGMGPLGTEDYLWTCEAGHLHRVLVGFVQPHRIHVPAACSPTAHGLKIGRSGKICRGGILSLLAHGGEHFGAGPAPADWPRSQYSP